MTDSTTRPGRPTDQDPHAPADAAAIGHRGVHAAATSRRTGALALLALGIVYGDIGTSPLYAFRETLETDGVAVTQASALGVASLAFWALVVVITVKYLLVVMRADANGEGGIFALTTLLRPRDPDAPPHRRHGTLVLLGVFGTALLYGDGAITPAISVLSAVEGLEVVTDAASPVVIPIAITILIGLFSVQFRGTASLGAVFGRLMLVWFGVLAVLGIASIATTPSVLRALNPAHGLAYLADGGLPAFLSLGALFLVVTGGEALYADMGHFGRRPIAVGWVTVVFPALTLNYLGQAALLLRDPEAIESPFYLLAPGWGLVPLVVLATAATVIASQALISGVFSLSVQAIQQNFLPRVKVVHTSEEERGQVYLPAMNAALLVACVGLVVGFRTSGNLAAAYGVAVTATMLITTVLFTRVAIDRFGWPPVAVYAGAALIGVADVAFLVANLFKIPHGGWFPLVAGAVIFLLMTTWSTGRRLLTARLFSGGTPLRSVLPRLASGELRRLPGTAVMLYSRPGIAPPALLNIAEHFGGVHERVICLTVRMREIAHVVPPGRLSREVLGEGVEQWVLSYGFRDRIDVPAALAVTTGEPGGVDPAAVSYFLGRETIKASDHPGMALWRERLFGVLLANSRDAASFFELPPERTTTVGKLVEI